MRSGSARLDPAEDVAGAVQPRERLAAMLLLDRVHWHHLGDKSADFLMQRQAAHLPPLSEHTSPAWQQGTDNALTSHG
jgi:hypothetical protein